MGPQTWDEPANQNLLSRLRDNRALGAGEGPPRPQPRKTLPQARKTRSQAGGVKQNAHRQNQNDRLLFGRVLVGKAFIA